MAERLVEERESGPSLHLFEDIVPRYHNRWRAFVVSCFLHGPLLWGLSFVAEGLPAARDEAQSITLSARPLEIRIPERLYLASGGRGQAKSPAPADRPPAQGKQIAGAKAAPRMFELPDLPIQAKRNQTLLQPQYPPDLAPAEKVRLPEVMFWASPAPNLPRPAPKPFVLPGRTNPEAQPPKLDAPPRLEVPNREMVTGDMAVASANLDRVPSLPRPPATTMPIRTFQPPRPGPAQRNPSIDPFEGDPANVLALAPNAPPLSEILRVPAGNLRAPLLILPPPEAGEGAAKAAASEAGGGFGARGAAAAAGAGTTAAVAIPSNSGKPGVAPLASPTPVPGALSATVTQLAAGMALRILHPTNGVFDIVVESSSSEALPESAGILSGRPIYTVYLRIGASKDWVLQYCALNAVDAVVSGGVLRLGNPAPLKAPFPRLTFLPMARLPPRDGYLMFHGVIDDLGQFQNLKAVGRADPKVGALVLAFLEKWEFRPATRDSRPVPVEILLAIPPGA